jgi:hypothetical protein
MLDNEILDQALVKKNKEIERLTKSIDEVKKGYEVKIKNLMNSINSLKSQNQELNNNTKDNVRVTQIKSLKQEIADKEKVILLLRRLIDDEERVDKYLLKEFAKLGDQRFSTYEEQKIKIKQLEAELVQLKFKKGKPIDEVERDKAQMKGLEDNVSTLQSDNEKLKETNEKLIKMQNELLDKLKSYNQEIGEMKSIYETIKYNLEEEHKLKILELTDRAEQSERENIKLKEKIRELIQIGENSKKDTIERIKKQQAENDIFKRLLESKKQEVNILVDELAKYKSMIDNKETKPSMKIDLGLNEKKESEQKLAFLEKLIKQKDHQIEQLRTALTDKDQLIAEKDLEIELINNKLLELEEIAINNYNSNL